MTADVEWYVYLFEICRSQVILSLSNIGIVLAQFGLVNLQSSLVVSAGIVRKFNLIVLHPFIIKFITQHGSANRIEFRMVSRFWLTNQCLYRTEFAGYVNFNLRLHPSTMSEWQLPSYLSTSSYLPWFWQRRARLFSCLATSGWSEPRTFSLKTVSNFNRNFF